MDTFIAQLRGACPPDDPRFKLLQVVEVATSWNTRHPLIVHMTQPASSAARAALKGEL